MGDHVRHWPRSMTFWASTIRRAVAISNAHVRSAVVSVSTPGVLVTSTPRRVQAATSMLSYPTAMLATMRSEEHTSELQSREKLVCGLLLEKKNQLMYALATG